MVIRRLFVLAVAAALPFAALAKDAPETDAAADPGVLCDSLAGYAADADFTGTGVTYDDLDAAKAEPACRAAVAAHPGERRYYFQLARALLKNGSTDAAVAAYEKAADMGSIAALVDGLGLIYENGDGVEQDYQKAATYYRRAIDAGSTDALGYLAYLYDFGLLGDNGVVEAKKLYERQIELTNDAYALTNLGFLYQGGRPGVEKDLAKAEALMRQGAASDDADAAAYARNSLAFLFAGLGRNLDEADALATDAIAAVADSDDDVNHAAYLDTRAFVRHVAGRDAEALIDAEAAVALDPEASEYLNRLGDIYLALGRKDEARAAWQQVLTMEPPNPYYEVPWTPAEVQKKLDEL